MSTALDITRKNILEPSEIGDSDLEGTLGRLLNHAVDNADLYFQSTHYESWVLEDGIVKEGSHNIEQGVGVRAIAGEKSGFAYSDEIMLPALTQAATTARAIAQSGDRDRDHVEMAGAADSRP